MAPSDPSLRGILRPLSQIRDDMPTSECLETMIQERIHIALVSDANRKIIGMLTLEDILEELVGEIHDEYDRLPTTITRSGNGWIIGGHATLPNIQATTGLHIVDEEPSATPKTLNDWVVRKLGKPVEGGEILVSDGIRVVVRKVRRQLVQEALVDTEVQSTKWN
jgi:putative hemolysin